MKTVKPLYIIPKPSNDTIKKLLSHGVWVFNPATLIDPVRYTNLMKDYIVIYVKR